MAILSLDLETRSTADLQRVGAWLYAHDPSTEVLLLCYRRDGGEVRVWWHDQPIPPDLRDALEDPTVELHAWNAGFERAIFGHVLAPLGWPLLAFDRWHCSMARARACGLPGGLEKAAQAFGLPVQKDVVGYKLMRTMSAPLKGSTEANPQWLEDIGSLNRLATYCAQDVRVESDLAASLPPLSPQERLVWQATERMNDGGVRFDLEFVEEALGIAEITRGRLNREIRHLTGGAVSKTTQLPALKRWLLTQGASAPEEGALAAGKAEIAEWLADPASPLTPVAREVLVLRLEAAKISESKLDAIQARTDARGYARGLLTYHGAATGRWSAANSGVQIQNFPRKTVSDWPLYLRIMQQGYEAFDALCGPPLEAISGMLRGSIIPDEGCDLISVDYAAVELRGLAWLAGQEDLIAALRAGSKIYERMAGAIFGIPWQQVQPDSPERFLGKTVVLGCGYQMGAAKLATQCAGMGQPISEALATRAIETYRSKYPRIQGLWYEMDWAAMEAVRRPGTIIPAASGRLKFLCASGWLQLRLPSGRRLRYRKPRIEVHPAFGRHGLVYDGVIPQSTKWGPQSGYGGRLVENVVQGLCRDLIAEGMLKVADAGYRLVALVHDETITTQPIGWGSVEDVVDLLCDLPHWASGMPVAAEGFRAERYG